MPQYVTTQSPSTHAECSCAPARTECQGLECVCRPRFFAGQLLTEFELNGMMEYIRSRNRQQNKMMGVGVVCGLDVSCNPCGGGTVTVGAGHALSPCGEDITVCDVATVNVCDLIERCIEREPNHWDCAPLGGNNANCKDVEEEWVLSIRYKETVSRPTTVVRGAGSVSTRGCSCGTSAGGGAKGLRCGCRSTGRNSSESRCNCGTPGKVSTTRCVTCTPVVQSRPYQPECEPTLVCESYEFSVSKKILPKPVRGTQRDLTWRERLFQACALDLQESLPGDPGKTVPSKHAWVCAALPALEGVILRHGVHDCSLLERLRLLRCPAADDLEFAAKYAMVRDTIKELVGHLLKSFFCDALLPPCPPAQDDDRVALATIKVRRSPCTVVSICNWDVRSVVMTPAAMSYWLSMLGVTDGIRRAVHSNCCEPEPQLHHPGTPTAGVGRMLFASLGVSETAPSMIEQLAASLFAAKPSVAADVLDDPLSAVLAYDVVSPFLRETGLDQVLKTPRRSGVK
jgi:hypothetical protein